MKKSLILVFGLIFITTANAQWKFKKVKGNGNVVTKERNVGTYDKVSVSSYIDVELVSGKEGKLSVKADENFLQYIVTEVKNGNLKVRIQKGINLKSSGRDRIIVTVPFEDISSATLSGSGSIVTKNAVNADQFSAYVSGSGRMKLEVNAKNLEGTVSGSGGLRLEGKTRDLDCKVSGSGNIRAYELVAENVNVTASGSGNIKVNCKETLSARVSGSGSIQYKGNPSKEDSKVSGSGSISKT